MLSQFILTLNGPDDFVAYEASKSNLREEEGKRKDYRKNFYENGEDQILLNGQMYVATILCFLFLIIVSVQIYLKL